MKDRLNFAIVGMGNIGKRHARHILHNSEARLAAICDIEPGALNDSDFPPEIKRFRSLDILLNEPDIDVVNICTPNYLHHSMTVQSLLSGKNVVCEKPMALKVKDCRNMIAIAASTGKQVFVVKQNRYNSPVHEVKKLINDGTLGKIYMITINCFWNRNDAYYEHSAWRGKKKLDGGCLFTQFSHFVDIMYYLLGHVTCISGRVANFGHRKLVEFEDTGIFELTTPAGTLISFNFTTCAYGKNMEGSFTVIGENGSVKIGGEYLNKISYQHVKDYIIPEIAASELCNDYGTYQGSMSNHDKMIQNVIDTLKGKAMAKTSAEDGLKVVEIIEQMYNAANSRQSIPVYPFKTNA